MQEIPGFGLSFGTNYMGTYHTREEMHKGGKKMGNFEIPEPSRRSKSVLGLRSNYKFDDEGKREEVKRPVPSTQPTGDKPKPKKDVGRVCYHLNHFCERPDGGLTLPPTQVKPPEPEEGSVNIVPQEDVKGRMQRLERDAKKAPWHQIGFQPLEAAAENEQHCKEELAKRDPNGCMKFRSEELAKDRAAQPKRVFKSSKKAYHKQGFEAAKNAKSIESEVAPSPNLARASNTYFVKDTESEELKDWPFGKPQVREEKSMYTRHAFHNHNFSQRPEVSTAPHPDDGHRTPFHKRGYQDESVGTENAHSESSRRPYHRIGFESPDTVQASNNEIQPTRVFYHMTAFEDPKKNQATRNPRKGGSQRAYPWHLKGYESGKPVASEHPVPRRSRPARTAEAPRPAVPAPVAPAATTAVSALNMDLD